MRKQIIIASAILVFILFIVFLISRPKTNQIKQEIFPTPTTIPIDIEVNEQLVNEALALTPYEDENFIFDYSTETGQFIVQEKTSGGKQEFLEWANQNNLSELAANPELIVFEDKTGNQLPATSSQSPEFNPIIEFFNIFLNLGRGDQPTTSHQSLISNLQPPISNLQSPTTSHQSLIYYAQCNSEYADLPLPDGCNMCQAGCGAATVAMIASSYLGNQYDPQNIINQYKSKGYLLSCAGSRYADARSILQSLGLKTTDYIIFNFEPADQVVSDLKKYFEAGWTFFTLANFKDGGGGHYFWITDIDNKGNIWAYDPYYGRFEAPPINENSRYPFPKYRIAFGVKK